MRIVNDEVVRYDSIDCTTPIMLKGEEFCEVVLPYSDNLSDFMAVADAIIKKSGQKLTYHVGNMIEIPRAALLAGDIAKESKFFSFGTNDLTQMTYGFSRDDAGKFLPDYYKNKIFEQDPFATVDQNGVGKLIAMAVKDGKANNKGIHFGVCGEHGGDPVSIEFFHNVGLDYVSCSPFRVPVARLAAAQAAIKAKRAKKK